MLHHYFGERGRKHCHDHDDHHDNKMTILIRLAGNFLGNFVVQQREKESFFLLLMIMMKIKSFIRNNNGK